MDIIPYFSQIENIYLGGISPMNVLIINAGSSSLKYQLMNPETGAVSAKGLCERIYIDGRLTHNANGKKVVKDIPMPTHSEAIQAVLAILVDPVDGVIKSTDEIDAVGHRVLHGGMEFFDVNFSYIVTIYLLIIKLNLNRILLIIVFVLMK